jgi:predicted  nucleic acid-binding Zn-ribbon protein
VDQHNVKTGNQYADLEKRLETVLEKLNEMTREVHALQQQQTVLIGLVKSKSKL